MYGEGSRPGKERGIVDFYGILLSGCIYVLKGGDLTIRIHWKPLKGTDNLWQGRSVWSWGQTDFGGHGVWSCAVSSGKRPNSSRGAYGWSSLLIH